ncbi:Protein purity of essence [Pseudolycoriella hygida]|uniref:Protein purity of essence n=1 Tax=Pseudolycoriella hygida TaxID=35572 RepID=A0A9Q0MJV6_9DIPT|nr:Protein purity of essence [Pseudolycoriella hygida]
MFYMSLACLAATSISGQCNSISQSNLPIITEASSIIIRFIISKLEKPLNSDTKLFLPKFLPALKCLCEGRSLSKDEDVATLTTILRNAKCPEHVKSATSTNEKDSKCEIKASRSDLSSVILQQLTTPLGVSNAYVWTPLSEELTDCSVGVSPFKLLPLNIKTKKLQELFVKANTDLMEALGIGDVILRVCTTLPSLSKYYQRYEDTTVHGKPLFLPIQTTEATVVKNSMSQMSSDMSILSLSVSLPILEPLTPSKIKQLSQCEMSALYCAVLTSIAGSVLNTSSSQKSISTASGASESEECGDDDPARNIVDKALEIFNSVGEKFKTTREHIYQNHLCMGAWLLVSGIQGAMGASGSNNVRLTHGLTDDVPNTKGKSPSRSATDASSNAGRVNLVKVQQGFGVLNAAIANHTLVLLTELIGDLVDVEPRSDEDKTDDPADFDILGKFTSLQRVIRVLNTATMQQLLTFLATVSYRKACQMKRVINKSDGEAYNEFKTKFRIFISFKFVGDPVSYSDSTTYYNDTICSSEDSESDDEEDSYLGIWFKETLSPELKETPVESSTQDKASDGQRGGAMVSAKDEPHEYLELSAEIFAFLDTSLGSNHKFLNKYVKSGLSEQQMILLANILKDLDRDAARGDQDMFDTQWTGAMNKFASSLGRYLHNLLSGGQVSEPLQSALLIHLGVSPWTQDPTIWPLQVYSRTLSVLVQILLLKPSQEKEAACLSVWQRLVNTLVEGVCSTQTEAEYVDLNVEHAQLLLFLFHSLNLMQKKSVLLLTAGGVIRCAEVCRGVTPEKPLKDHQIILLSRLLLFLEYLMKHLYNSPTVLLEQVRWNLFSVITLDQSHKVSDTLNNKMKMMSFCRRDLEEKYRKHSTDYGTSVRPKFYSLTVVDAKIQQEFKLDGLAWNFILCTPDKLKYPLLVDALIDILGITDICSAKVSFQTLCAVNYCFSLCWKLILGLPPSTPHVEALMQDKTPNLHLLVWGVRCLQAVPSSNYLIVNSLIKQGMFTQFAEGLWSKITTHVSDVKYSLKQTILGLESFNKTFWIQNPRLSKIVLLDALVSHLYAIYWSEKEGSKPAVASGTTTPTKSNSASSPSEFGTTSPEASNTSTESLSASGLDESKSMPITTNDELVKELMTKALNALETIKECCFKLNLSSLHGTIPIVLLESLISIAGHKNVVCSEIAQQFPNLLSGQDKDIILTEWRKNLLVISEDNLTPSTRPVEYHTLSVIDAHINEIYKYPTYSIVLSMKHTMKSILNLIFYLLPSFKDVIPIEDRLKSLLVTLLFDVRTEFLYDIANKCLSLLIGSDASSDAYVFPIYSNVLRYTYKLLIDFADISSQGRNVGLNESVLHNVLKCWEQMLEKPVGLKAMHEFFSVTKQGSLVQVLLSFANTSLSQLFSTKILQFFEKLFQASEKPDSQFKLDELCLCVSELGQVENSKLKTWLSHILLGPVSTNAVSSAASSNVPTPTNMATVSAIPSISDQVVQPSELTMDPNVMDIDYDCSGAAAGPTSSAWHASITTNRSGSDTPNEECLEKNGRLLQTLTKYIVTENRISPNVSASLFQALVQLGQNLLCPTQDSIEFNDILQVMVTLADAGHGKGHAMLFSAAIDWLDVSRNFVMEKSLTEKPAKINVTFQNVTSLLRYMADLLHGLGLGNNRSANPPWEDEQQPDFEDYFEDTTGEDEDSSLEDSDEDSLSSKLCTYSLTEKEYMIQHWYNCHTCKMVDSVGVCSICARVCHKNHDLSYSKHGNFFCDCGAKADMSCQALTKRTNSQQSESSMNTGYTSDVPTTSAIRRRTVSPSRNSNSQRDNANNMERALQIAKLIEMSKDSLKNPEQWKTVLRSLLDFFEFLLPSVKENCAKYSTVGCHLRAKNALERLHQPDKTFAITDQIMLPTLGSQEGAFENVRSNFVGDQAQIIRQLIASNTVRRVGLCCLSSPHGKRQHLAVSHEKGKVTILQLSSLLKQADIAKKKLTLSRLASAPISCTIMSLASNPVNEEFLAVCGLKECHVLSFCSTGSVNEHIVITPQLETGNYIKRALWLPGSQTMLAIITCDYVKIYELSEDTYSPQYYFVVPSGKIRDCTFVYQSGNYFLLLFASSGYIYTQALVDESLAKHGAFYVTNTLEIDHPMIVESKGALGEGGASIYYSHLLQMLFLSYSIGKNFMAPLTDVNEGVKCVVLLQTTPQSKNSSKSTSQALMQWSEVAGHPGLIFAMQNQSNNPVIFMLKPEGILMQEIKYSSAKAKIIDMVAIRHTTGGVERSTLLLLCEDGSLRIFAANPKFTSFWLSPEVQPVANQLYQSFQPKSLRRSKKVQKNQPGQGNAASSGQPQFPVDFFEHYTLLHDIDYGGCDLLQIYNTQQLKHRIDTTGLYVASTRSSGFTLEVTNNDPKIVMTGFRVLIGTQDVARAPPTVTVYGRVINTFTTRPRWFDIPLTHEESLRSDKKLSILFGPTQDPDKVCMLDCIKVYGKSKELIGWPEESDDVLANGSTSNSQLAANAAACSTSQFTDSTIQTITPLDKMLTIMLEVLDSGLGILGASKNEDSQLKKKSIEIATYLLLYPLPNVVQNQAKWVLATLHNNRAAYNAYKDKEILSEVNSELEKLKTVRDLRNIDPEAFFRLVVLARNIAVARPQALTKITTENNFNIIASFMVLLKGLYSITPNYELQSSIVRVGLSHTESTIHCLVEIIYAFALSDQKLVDRMTSFLVQLLLDKSSVISHSTKQAMIRLLRPRGVKRRKVLIGSPPDCPSPTNKDQQQELQSNEEGAVGGVSNDEQIGALGLEGAVGTSNPQASMLGAVGGFPQLMDLQQDADEEAIMEIAIALSLQEHEIPVLQQGLADLQRGIMFPSLNDIEAPPEFFNTSMMSTGGSDDEGSNAATEGSTLRTSPAEHAGSVGSESGGSGESIGGASGRSSNYDDQLNHSPPRNESKLQTLTVQEIATLKSIDGHQSIPFMQVILMLTSDLDGNQEMDRNVLSKLLSALIDRLEITPSAEPNQMALRSPKTEVQLVILRLVHVLMAKIKSSKSSSANATVTQQARDNSTFVGTATANALLECGAIPYCLSILKSFLPYWRNMSNNDKATVSGTSIITTSAGPTTSNVLKVHVGGPERDLSPFFGGTNDKSDKNVDVFEQYSANITEIAVRLPYQILKLTTNSPATFDWFANIYEYMSHTLCEYMMVVTSQVLRRIIRKLLLYVCGSKDKYRQSRDIHSLDTHIKMIKKYNDTTITSQSPSVQNNSVLNYDELVELTEHLKGCQDVASVRTGNWQRFCVQHNDVLPSLIRIGTNQLAEGVAPVILQLLQGAICNLSEKDTKNAASVKMRQDRDKSEDADLFPDSKFDSNLCATLVANIFAQVAPTTLTKFIKIYLLETNTLSIRWQAHGLIYAFYENSNLSQKERLLNSMWELWPLLPAYGRRTAQFVDLLGYLTLTTKEISEKVPEYMGLAVAVLRQQNERIAKHPNAPIYTALGQVLDLEGYYLESEPCLVCNNPEVPMSNIKLSSVKQDSKFTTTTTIVKLTQSHIISKIILRIADAKRTKMVRTINIYYNNRTVQAVVELKNRPSMWHKARKVTLEYSQIEEKIEFPLPITACNLMIEYADFYETVTGSSENLQCPRCSAAVPANPGVCGNCGENVFQCHKCRAINYDEKDPFLCHSCGFCKYAKFDYNIYGRACCAVDPIESADDRAKTVLTIHNLLEKADRVYRSLQDNKQILELLVQKVADQKLDRATDESIVGNVVSTSQVNKVIQLLAQKYSVESKNSFEELSKHIQKVQACRRELVAYDRSQMDLPTTPLDNNDSVVIHNRCYGCALASTEQCLTLLRAMASNIDCRVGLCQQGLVDELAQNNLRRGTIQIQDEVRNLLCLLTRDLPEATQSLCNLILTRVKLVLSGIAPFSNIDSSLRHEMSLLESMVAHDDSCWEQKLKVVLEIFLLACRDVRGPPVSVLQPCLKVFENLICPSAPKSKTNKDLTTEQLYTIKPTNGLTVDYREWLADDPLHTFDAWKSRMPPVVKASSKPTMQDIPCNEDEDPTKLTETGVNRTKVPRMFIAVLEKKRQKFRTAYLAEKYGLKWRRKVLSKGVRHQPLKLTASWLQSILFNANSRIARQLATSLIPALINKNFERKREILDLLTGFLKYIGEAEEASDEFLILYRCLAKETPWRQYLIVKKVLVLITDLLAVEIEKIHRFEETTLSSDLAQGYALRQLVELLAMFIDNPKILQVYKSKLVGPVLQSYLSLRKLVVQRTRLVDDAQQKLLEMLEEMTTGTEDETRAFMSVLINTVRTTPMNDIKTPVFIFERLCSIIHPEENDVGEFFLTLEKDAQQEDFLQGRMLGNPYPSSEAGLGPLMRDVKNKICTDCELVALLEDDNGMELLVHNKIISLDLPVKEVYKKIWLAEGGERDTMRIVYRMRGLMGDATEEFVETFNNKSIVEVDNEQLYRMANVLADCGGLKVMLDRIVGLQSIMRSRSLLQVLLKLFLLAVKVTRCQEVLCQPELGAINTLLKVLQLCLQGENDSQQSAVTEQLLEIMETILSKAASDTLDSFLQFSLTFGGLEYVTALISCTNCTNVRNSPSVLRHLIRVLAALVYGNDLKMALLCEHFKGALDFQSFDSEYQGENEFRMELFCVLTNQIEHNSIGGTLKDYIIGLGIVEKSIEYIRTHAPCVKPTLLRTDSDELKEFISRPSLKYILRFLTGLANKHEASCVAIAKEIIPIIHRLEQVSSDEHVGSLAENLMDSLCTDPTTAKCVQQQRDFTRAEKKRLAMVTREKQLDALGMRTNEKGQVTAKGSILQKIEKLREETGLTCFICREGYACQPSKVLGIYTFTKRTNIEEFEQKSRKTLGYTTVTHFNVVHIDCHMSAIRLARARDEWESASLQNANTRCNGLLPLWGPEVVEAAFASCMTRHNANMQESTQRCEITFSSAIHDLKLLLLRFAQEKSFHDDAGGGGPQSNMHLVPYLLFYSLYIFLSSRSFTREEKQLTTALTSPINERWLESAYEVEGPLYQITLSLALHTPDLWKKHRIAHLKRLIVIGHARHSSPSAVCKSVTDNKPKDYSVYKPFLMMWAMIDCIYADLFKTVQTPKEEEWPMSLFDYIRRNDEVMLKATDKILETFTEQYLPCADFSEFCDVAGLLNVIDDPVQFLSEVIGSLPATSSTA